MKPLPEIGVLKRRQIEQLWDKGLDTYEIALRLNLDEARVYTMVGTYVRIKQFRKTVF